MQFPFFTDLQRAYWAQDNSCNRGQLFAPNSKQNFFWCPPKLLLLSKPLCVVCVPAASLPLLYICFWGPCIPLLHMHTHHTPPPQTHTLHH